MGDENSGRRSWLKLPSRLPPLHGRWLRIYVIIWSLVLPLAVIGPVAGSVLLYQRASLLPFGISILQDDTGVRLTTVWGEEARAAGLRPGDRMTTVAGRPVNSRALREHLAVPEGSTVIMGFARAGGAVRGVPLPRLAERAEALYGQAWLSQPVARVIELALTSLPMLFLVAAAIILFLRRKDSTAAMLSLTFLLISATSLWLPTAWRDFDLEAVSAPFGDAAWSLLVVVLLGFPSGRLEPRWTAWVAVAVMPWLLLSVIADPPAAVENSALVLLFAIALFALGLRYRRLSLGPEKLQLRWAFFGFAVGIPALAAAALFPLAWAPIAAWDARFVIWTPLICFFLFSAGIAFICSGLIVALLRHRLYDADAVISRTACYAAMTVLLAATFATISKVIDWILPTLIGGDSRGLPAVAGVLAGLMVVTPARESLNRWADRRFRKPLTDLRDGLPTALLRLTPIAGLSDLSEEIVSSVSAGLHPTRIALLLGGSVAAAQNASEDEIEAWRRDHSLEEPARQLVADRSDPVFPVRLPLNVRSAAEGPPLGWILIGPRPDDSLYPKDEYEALSGIAREIAQALQTVVLRDARSRELATRLTAIEAAVARLGGRRPARKRPG